MAKINENDKKILKCLGVVSLSVSCFAIGLAVGRIFDIFKFDFNLNNQTVVTQQDLSDEEQRDLTLFWEVWNAVDAYYVDESKIDQEQMYYGAIKGVVDSLEDPATVFFTPEETEEFNNQNAGKMYEGIGAELGYKDGLIRVVSPIDGSPAEKAGLKPNDIIVKVDDRDIKSSDTVYDAVDYIRGESGTEVVLTVMRESESELIEVPITRGKIDLPSISIKKVSNYSPKLSEYNDEVAVIDVSRFTDESPAVWRKNWDNAVDEVVDSGKKKVVIDLRGNPGGFFNSAIYAADEFIAGKEIIATQKDRQGSVEEFKAGRKGEFEDGYDVVMLVNEGSASASEILAGSVQFYDDAVIVGMPTFGKGTAQDVIPLEKGSSLHLTTLKWLLPGDDWINPDDPVEPDHEVDYTDENFEDEIDPQMEKALEIFN